MNILIGVIMFGITIIMLNNIFYMFKNGLISSKLIASTVTVSMIITMFIGSVNSIDSEFFYFPIIFSFVVTYNKEVLSYFEQMVMKLKKLYQKIEFLSVPKFIVFFTDARFVFSMLLVLLVGTWFKSNSAWMGAYGSIITMSGIFMITRGTLRKTIKQKVRDSRTVDYGNLDSTKEEINEEREVKKDIESANFGFWLTVIGTLWWGYGSIVYDFVIRMSPY
ncbi:hypothetical protein [Sulfurimonas sp.]|uniref:hypothetical protein n=1 Tax=Sulfurimonas sp. TaxID=2022749 RepID=UPI0025EDAB2A|nr:hypothetical protein [Sulfurimonas sp.]